MRQLATIQTIKDINEIPKSDFLERATVLGWHCVVKKNEFKVGEKIVYIEVDSVCPEWDEFEFLRSRKFRVRTIKLRGQISQGLVLPLTILTRTNLNVNKLKIGDEVTEHLNIKKYLTPSEKEEFETQKRNKHWTKQCVLTKWLWKYKWFRDLVFPIKPKGFPTWVIKTDEERVQKLQSLLSDYADYDVVVTEKIDYQSFTATANTTKNKWKNKTEFIVCSRNLKNNDKQSLYWRIVEKYKLDSILPKYKNITLQGEQGSSKVQGNKYKLNTIKMWVFNIVLHDENLNRTYLDYDEMTKFCYKHRLDIVPLVKKCKLKDLGNSIDELVEFSKGKSVINPSIQREGVVVSCIKNGKKSFSFKIINPNFLLKYED